MQRALVEIKRLLKSNIPGLHPVLMRLRCNPILVVKPVICSCTTVHESTPSVRSEGRSQHFGNSNTQTQHNNRWPSVSFGWNKRWYIVWVQSWRVLSLEYSPPNSSISIPECISLSGRCGSMTLVQSERRVNACSVLPGNQCLWPLRLDNLLRSCSQILLFQSSFFYSGFIAPHNVLHLWWVSTNQKTSENLIQLIY